MHLTATPCLERFFVYCDREGRLLITTVFLWPEHEAPYVFRRMTSYGLEALLRAHGLDDIHVTKVGSDIATIVQLWINFLWRVTTPSNKFNFALFLLLVCAPSSAAACAFQSGFPTTGEYYLTNILQAGARTKA